MSYDLSLGLGLGLSRRGGALQPIELVGSNPLGLHVVQSGSDYSFSSSPYDAIDFTPDASYYVNYASGSDSNDGLSLANAKKTLTAAMDAAEASANTQPEVIIIDEICGMLSWLRGEHTTFTKSIKVRSGSPSGRTIMTNMRESYVGTENWSVHSGNCYKTAVYNSPYFDKTQFDNSVKDAKGGPTPLIHVADAATCVSTPGSFFHDTSTTPDTTYVHMADGREPDTDWVPNGHSAYKFYLSFNAATGTILFEDLTFLYNTGASGNGHATTFVRNLTLSNTARCGYKNCLFYGGQEGYANKEFAVVVLENCHAKYNRNDGFNYHSSTAEASAFGVIYEYNCTSEESGSTRWNSQPSLGTSANGSTGHDALTIYRVNGDYRDCNGPVVADVDGCDSFCFGCYAEFPNLGTTENATNACFYAIDAVGDGPARMYLYGCDGSVAGQAGDAYLLSQSSPVDFKIKAWAGASSPWFGTIGNI